MSDRKDVWVVLESSGDDASAINSALLLEGSRIASGLGGALSALAVGWMCDELSFFEQYDLACLFHLQGEELTDYQSENHTWAISSFVRAHAPRLLLFAQTDRGSELAPGVAARLDTAAAIDVSAIEIRDGNLFYTKPCYDEQFEQEISFATGLLEIAAIRPTEAMVGIKGPGKTVQKSVTAMDVPSGMAKTTPLSVIAPDYRTVDIIHARNMIGVGMGCATEACLPEIKQLGELIQASLGTTRPVVDEGLLPKSRMIGMTGKTVAPKFYLAIGISGSPHHVAGIQKAERIVSINKDPGAPIFQASDIGFHADIKEILPLLTKRIEEWRKQNP